MSYERLIVIFCDTETSHCDIFKSTQTFVKPARKEAHKAGWRATTKHLSTHTNILVDICPNCLTKAAGKKAPARAAQKGAPKCPPG